MNADKSRSRHAHLAAAYRRGIPYRVLELTTRRDNKPDPLELFQALAGKKRREELKTRSKEEFKLTLAPIIEWLNQPAPDRCVKVAIVHREQYIAAKIKRREAFKAARACASSTS